MNISKNKYINYENLILYKKYFDKFYKKKLTKHDKNILNLWSISSNTFKYIYSNKIIIQLFDLQKQFIIIKNEIKEITNPFNDYLHYSNKFFIAIYKLLEYFYIYSEKLFISKALNLKNNDEIIIYRGLRNMNLEELLKNNIKFPYYSSWTVNKHTALEYSKDYILRCKFNSKDVNFIPLLLYDNNKMNSNKFETQISNIDIYNSQNELILDKNINLKVIKRQKISIKNFYPKTYKEILNNKKTINLIDVEISYIPNIKKKSFKDILTYDQFIKKIYLQD